MKPFKITLRKDRNASGLLEAHRATEAAHAPRSRLILLVHGYNVSEGRAVKTYQRFKDHFKAQGAHILAEQLGEVYWPGSRPDLATSTAAFPFLVPRTIAMGAVFEEYLRERRSPKDQPSQIVLIGHSLGCRLILEALKIMAEQKRPHDVRVFLMAAGVPVQMVEPEGRLRQAVEFASQAYTFHSVDDWVIKLAFPAGQRLAREKGIKRFDAVGREGKPEPGTWTKGYPMKGFGHGDYWDKPQAANIILRKLGKPAPRPIAVRILKRIRGPQIRLANFSREIMARKTPTHNVS